MWSSKDVLSKSRGAFGVLLYTAVTKTSNITEMETDLSSMAPIHPIRTFRPNPNLEIAFDTRSRNPVYVLERLQVSPKSERASKRRHFFEEKSLPEAARSRNHHYRNSGYDRGHLAPAADFSHSQEQQIDTYNLCNVSPQHQDLNRGLWAKLEQWTRAVAKRNVEATTYVVTGPLWLPKLKIGEEKFLYSYVGLGNPPSLVSVPSHLFKVVVVVKGDTIVEFACFVLANDNTQRSLKDTLVSWSDLEAVSGMEFFPQLVNPDWKAAADSLTVTQQKNGPKLLQSSKRNAKRYHCQQLQHLCSNGRC